MGLTAAPVTGILTQSDGERITIGKDYERTFGPNESEHTYTFTVEKGEYIRVTMSGPPDEPAMELRGPNGEQLLHETLYPDHTPYGTVAPADGEYTLTFTSPLQREHPYWFTVDIAGPDRVGPTSNPGNLEPGTPETAALQQGDIDAWEVKVENRGTLTMTVEHDHLIGANVGAEIINTVSGETVTRKETNCSPGTGPCEIGELSATVDPGVYEIRLYDTGGTSPGNIPGFVEYTVSASAPDAPDTKRIRISSDDQVHYRFSVSGEVWGIDTDPSETIDDNRVEGIVNGGDDVFEYTGEIQSYEDDGAPTVEIDGEQVDPHSLGDKRDDTWRRLTITSDDRADYAFEVDGEVRPVDTNLEDTIEYGGTSARGVVHGGEDVYEVRGPVVHFETDGDADATVNGRSVQPFYRTSSMPDRHGLRITGDGDKDTRVVYDITVTGEIQMADKADEDEESVSGSSASGGIVDDEDSFVYTGNIVSIDARGDGDATFEDETGDEIDVTVHDTSSDTGRSSTSTPTPAPTATDTPAPDDASQPESDDGARGEETQSTPTPTSTPADASSDGDNTPTTQTEAGEAGPSMPSTGTATATEDGDADRSIDTARGTDTDGDSGISTGVGDGFGAPAVVIALLVAGVLAVRARS